MWADEADCDATARSLAALPPLRKAFIELHGPLGAGKTTFVAPPAARAGRELAA
jgi:tRNA threonylcarbamoyladenosine biosynthesis protein TsaE